jgi:CheY-like chemotaxis protein
MLKILIIDDDAFVADIYKDLFEAADFSVDVATDGEEGCSRMVKSPPDAVLLDLMLNKVGGLDLLRIIRARPEFQHLPVVAYSKASEITLFKLAKEAGATRLFCKGSCKPSEIVAAVVAACAALPTATG